MPRKKKEPDNAFKRSDEWFSSLENRLKEMAKDCKKPEELIEAARKQSIGITAQVAEKFVSDTDCSQ